MFKWIKWIGLGGSVAASVVDLVAVFKRDPKTVTAFEIESAAMPAIGAIEGVCNVQIPQVVVDEVAADVLRAWTKWDTSKPGV